MVDKEAVEYLELRDSVERHGFLASISVRPAKVPSRFEILDGCHRYCVALDLSLPLMPCIIKHGVEDDSVLIVQIQANLQGVKTKPIEYARAVKKLLASNPEMGEKELAVLLNKSPNWINTLLGLLRLPEHVQKSVDRGDIPILSGYMLSRMPGKLQLEYLQRAKELSGKQFRQIAADALKRYSEAVELGRLEAFFSREFTPNPYLRHLREIQAEMAHHQAGPLLLAALNCQTPLDGFYAACQWFIHLDPQSISDQAQAARNRERTQQEEQPDVNAD